MNPSSSPFVLFFVTLLSFVQQMNGMVCPIGFRELINSDGQQSCWKVKGKETFTDKYNQCSGNQDSMENKDLMKHLLHITFYKESYFWSDLLRQYDKGPFVNWLIGDNDMGKPLEEDAVWDNSSNSNTGMCAVVNLYSRKYKVVDCDEKHFRLCIVRAYSNAYPVSWECPTEYISFPSPVPSCIFVPNSYSTARNVGLRANRQQADIICRRSSGYLLHRGYIYSNHPEFANDRLRNKELPLGIKRIGSDFLWEEFNESISLSERIFHPKEDFNVNKTFVSLLEDKWVLKESQYIYNRVMCEYFVEIPKINIYLFKFYTTLLFKTNVIKSMLDNIWCFTDSVTYYPTRVNFKQANGTNDNVIETVGDGFYWCLINNTIEYAPQITDKILFYDNEELVSKTYAMMILFNKLPSLRVGNISNMIEAELNNYLFNAMREERLIRSENQDEVYLITSIKIKRMFQDGHVLLHIQMEESGISVIKKTLMENVQLKLNSFLITYIRKILECDVKDLPEFLYGYFNLFNKYTIGETINTQDCVYYICSGDFNVGGYWVQINESSFCINTKTSTDLTTIFNTEDTTNNLSTTEAISTTILSPSEQVSEVAGNLQQIANGTVNAEKLASVASQINNVLDFGEDVEIPKSVLQDLDTIVNKVKLPKNERQITIVQPNIGIVVADRNSPTPIIGIKVNIVEDQGFTDGSLLALTADQMNRSMSNTKDTEMVVNVPSSIGTNKNARLSFVIFRNDNAFNLNTSKSIQRVNSRVLSVSITNISKFANEQFVDIHFRPYEGKTRKKESKMCAYWDFSSGTNGNWSTEGCELITGKDLDVCRCSHLTHFAEIIRVSNEDIGNLDNFVLMIISDVGCILSLIGLFIIGLTGVLFKSWRSDFNNKIWMHLSASVAFLMITFFVVSLLNLKDNDVSCVALGVILHYSLLSSFCWMFISALLSYKRLVTVFSKNASHRLLKACIFGWLIPLCPIIILFSVEADAYSKASGLSQISRNFCYPSGMGFWLTVFMPVMIIVACNFILFTIIIYSVFVNSNIQRHGDTKQLCRSITVSFLLFFLFGLTWSFGLFLDNIVMTYLFCGTATLQGFILFLFFIIGNKKTRELWMVCLRLKEKKKFPVTMSTSRSTTRGSSKNEKVLALRNVGYNNSSKPRALCGNADNIDSRFS